MTEHCSECTYLNLCNGDTCGKYWCSAKLERHAATEKKCYKFSKTYNKNSYESKNAFDFSVEHQKTGCYLTTIICDIFLMPDDCRILNSFRNFRNNIMQKDPKYAKLLVEYDIIGPKIADALKNDYIKNEVAYYCLRDYILPILEDIDKKWYDNAINSYIKMTNKLKRLYNIESHTINEHEIKNADIKNSGHGSYVKKISYEM